MESAWSPQFGREIGPAPATYLPPIPIRSEGERHLGTIPWAHTDMNRRTVGPRLGVPTSTTPFIRKPSTCRRWTKNSIALSADLHGCCEFPCGRRTTAGLLHFEPSCAPPASFIPEQRKNSRASRSTQTWPGTFNGCLKLAPTSKHPDMKPVCYACLKVFLGLKVVSVINNHKAFKNAGRIFGLSVFDLSYKSPERK